MHNRNEADVVQAGPTFTVHRSQPYIKFFLGFAGARTTLDMPPGTLTFAGEGKKNAKLVINKSVIANLVITNAIMEHRIRMPGRPIGRTHLGRHDACVPVAPVIASGAYMLL
jgi:hypothetical protein